MAISVGRRELIAALGSAVVWPLGARAQQRAMPVIGFLNAASYDKSAFLVSAFHQGLNETGFFEGRNVAFEYRSADGEYDRLPFLAADLVSRHVNVIAATGTPAGLPAKAATTSIPIVFVTGSDPAQQGLVSNFSRPEGNITGATTLAVELGRKRLELLHELVPSANLVAALVNPEGPNLAPLLSDLEAAAQIVGLRLHVMHASTVTDLDTVFPAIIELRADAVVIGVDTFFNSESPRLAALALKHSIPAMYQYREFVAAGGLVSYGGSITDAYHVAGTYAGRILKGEKPTELPVQQSTKAELFINLKTAKTLGIDAPPMLLARADEVIE
jgi:putative tryptophan/tyrosine transport system substrate-binding protein